MNFQQFKDLLPKKLQCKKVSEHEEIADYKHDVFYGFDENNQIYTITRDKKGNLHVLERDFEAEEKEKWNALKSLGEGMTLSTDPSLVEFKNQVEKTEENNPRREIILTPAKIKGKKGYTSIVIKFEDKTSTIALDDIGNIQLLENGKKIKIGPSEKMECSNLLRKPFEVSLVDKLKLGRIPYTGNDRLRHIEKTNQYRTAYVPITPQRMREWDD